MKKLIKLSLASLALLGLSSCAVVDTAGNAANGALGAGHGALQSGAGMVSGAGSYVGGGK